MWVAMVIDRLKTMLGNAFPDAAELDVVDRTGTGDHFHVLVVDAGFQGLSLLDQHRAVNDALAAALADGTIHELRITTRGVT
ncbi:MAG: BolA/IbaG family iron-sulfur metabolism protein [Gaiellaceae bacterium]